MPDAEALYARVRFLFETDDGSLPEVRLVGLRPSQTAAAYADLRARSGGVNMGAAYWDTRAQREAPVDAVSNAASLVVSGEAEPFHVVLQELRIGTVCLPDLGLFVFSDEIALDYRMGPDWGPYQVAGFFELLCELLRRAPGARVSLEEHVSPDVRDQFAAAFAQYQDVQLLPPTIPGSGPRPRPQ